MLRAVRQAGVEAYEVFTGNDDRLCDSASEEADNLAMRTTVRDMTSRHSELLKPRVQDLLREYGSPIYVVMHDGEIVHIAKTDIEACEFGDRRYLFEEFSVHGLTNSPKRVSGFSR